MFSRWIVTNITSARGTVHFVICRLNVRVLRFSTGRDMRGRTALYSLCRLLHLSVCGMFPLSAVRVYTGLTEDDGVPKEKALPR
jgi:hypothetical protein